MQKKKTQSNKRTHPVAKETRLNKFIADKGICSRRKAEDLILDGRVKINGKIVTELGTKVKESDNVFVDGDQIKYRAIMKYIVLNKPKDCITTTSDEKKRTTVMDIVHSKERLYPVGRLDRNTTGVLLLTNDGELAYRLTHPKFKIERMYEVGLDDELDPKDAKAISEGIELEDGEYTSPCEIFINPENKRRLMIKLIEGKNREIRRIFETLNYRVKKLDRKYYANLTTKGLARGEYRHLERTELNKLKKLVNLLHS